MARERFDIAFRLPASAYEELKAVSEYGAQLAAVADASPEVRGASDFRSAAKAVASALEISEDDAGMLVRGFSSLLHNLKDTEVPPAYFVDALTSHIENLPDWDDLQKERWRKSKGAVVELLKRNPLFVFTRAQELVRTHENLFLDCQLLTTVRPVFDENATDVLHFVVGHDLVVNYLSGTRKETIQLALDAADLAAIQSQCERAAIKASTVKEKLNAMNCPTTIWREPNEETSDD